MELSADFWLTNVSKLPVRKLNNGFQMGHNDLREDLFQCAFCYI